MQAISPVRLILLIIAIGSFVVVATPSLSAFTERFHRAITYQALSGITRSLTGTSFDFSLSSGRYDH